MNNNQMNYKMKTVFKSLDTFLRAIGFPKLIIK